MGSKGSREYVLRSLTKPGKPGKSSRRSSDLRSRRWRHERRKPERPSQWKLSWSSARFNLHRCQALPKLPHLGWRSELHGAFGYSAVFIVFSEHLLWVKTLYEHYYIHSLQHPWHLSSTNICQPKQDEGLDLTRGSWFAHLWSGMHVQWLEWEQPSCTMRWKYLLRMAEKQARRNLSPWLSESYPVSQGTKGQRGWATCPRPPASERLSQGVHPGLWDSEICAPHPTLHHLRSGIRCPNFSFPAQQLITLRRLRFPSSGLVKSSPFFPSFMKYRQQFAHNCLIKQHTHTHTHTHTHP